MFLSGHQRQDSLSVIVGLLLTRSSGIFPIIGQLINSAQVTDGVTRNNVESLVSHKKRLKKNQHKMISTKHLYPFELKKHRCLFLIKAALQQTQLCTEGIVSHG